MVTTSKIKDRVRGVSRRAADSEAPPKDASERLLDEARREHDLLCLISAL